MAAAAILKKNIEKSPYFGRDLIGTIKHFETSDRPDR